MTLLSSIWRRQVLSTGPKKCLPTDFAIESFKCLKFDEHLVMGRESQFDVPPFACKFSKTATSSHVLAVADEDGCVQLLNTKKYGPASVVKDWTAHSNAIFDIAWMHDEPKLITASGDQTALLWDINRDDALAVFKGHSCSLKSVNFRDEDYFVFATGARDGNIMVWDLRCNRRDGFYQPVNIIHHAHTQQASVVPQKNRRRGRRPSVPQPVSDSQQSVTSVVFQGENMLISSGAVDGNIKIWDLRKIYSSMRQKPTPCHMFPYPGSGMRKHGFSSLMLDSNQARLFASCTNDKIYMYNCASLTDKPICSYSGHLNSTFYVKAALSPDDQFLLSGSSSNDAYIWRVNTPEAAPMLLKGHLGEVTSVAWCPTDQGKLVTCSDDNNLRIWRMIRQPPTGDNTFNMELAGHCERSSMAPHTPSTKVPSSPNLDNTPPSSPLPRPSVVRTSRTTPVKIYTNPRLNQPASPVTMTTRSSNTSPSTPSLQNTPSSPLPRNDDFSNQRSPPRKLGSQTSSRRSGTEGSLAPFPVYDYDAPKSPLSVQLSPLHPPGSLQVVIKCKSPQQLLRTWLKKTPRKRPLEQESSNRTSLKQNEPCNINVDVNNSECLPSDAILDTSPESTVTLEHYSKLFFKSSVTYSSHQNCLEGSKENKCEDRTNYAARKENSPKSPQRKRLCVRSTMPGADNETVLQQKEIDTIHSHKKRQILATIQESTDNEKEDSVSKVAGNPSDLESRNLTVEEQASISDNWLTKLSKHMSVKYGIKDETLVGEPTNQADIDSIPSPKENESSSPQPTKTSQKPSVLRPSCGTILTYFKPAVTTS